MFFSVLCHKPFWQPVKMFSDMTETDSSIPTNSGVKLSNRIVTLTWRVCLYPKWLISGPKISNHDDHHSSQLHFSCTAQHFLGILAYWLELLKTATNGNHFSYLQSGKLNAVKLTAEVSGEKGSLIAVSIFTATVFDWTSELNTTFFTGRHGTKSRPTDLWWSSNLLYSIVWKFPIATWDWGSPGSCWDIH